MKSPAKKLGDLPPEENEGRVDTVPDSPLTEGEKELVRWLARIEIEKWLKSNG